MSPLASKRQLDSARLIATIVSMSQSEYLLTSLLTKSHPDKEETASVCMAVSSFATGSSTGIGLLTGIP